jgi:hypothetical protein
MTYIFLITSGHYRRLPILYRRLYIGYVFFLNWFSYNRMHEDLCYVGDEYPTLVLPVILTSMHLLSYLALRIMAPVLGD